MSALDRRFVQQQRTISALQRALERTQRVLDQTQVRVQSTVTRGVLARVDDTKKVQRAQIDMLADETEEDVEIFQPMGLTFVPEPNAEALVFSVGADRAHPVALCVQDPAKRPTGNKPNTGGLYTEGKFHFFVDDKKICHIGGDKAAKDFVSLATPTKDQFQEIRERIDKVNDFVTQLHTNFMTFTTHTHIVATAMGPATAAPVVPPVQPLTPVTPPLGAAKDVQSEMTKAS